MESQLKPQLDMIGSNLAGIVSKFENQFASLERTFQDQCKTVNGFYAKFSAAEGPKTEASTASPAKNQGAESGADDPDSNWQQQKQAMLDQYDGDAENNADADPAE